MLEEIANTIKISEFCIVTIYINISKLKYEKNPEKTYGSI